VVVDDVCSSGATLAAAATAVACWGLPVRAAVVAAPPRRDGWR
jgi:adenine/guanine phosphoribosyltransferase-like PRPP-binding protein